MDRTHPMKSSRTRFLLAFLVAELFLALISIPRIHVRNEKAWMIHTDQLLRDKAVILAKSIDLADLRSAFEDETQLQSDAHHLIWQIFDRDGRLVRQRLTGTETLSLPDNVRT